MQTALCKMHCKNVCFWKSSSSQWQEEIALSLARTFKTFPISFPRSSRTQIQIQAPQSSKVPKRHQVPRNCLHTINSDDQKLHISHSPPEGDPYSNSCLSAAGLLKTMFPRHARQRHSSRHARQLLDCPKRCSRTFRPFYTMERGNHRSTVARD